MGHWLLCICVPPMANPWRHQVSWASTAMSRRGGSYGTGARPKPHPEQSDLRANLISAMAQVFNQINFYHNQSDWSVESKRAFPTH